MNGKVNAFICGTLVAAVLVLTAPAVLGQEKRKENGFFNQAKEISRKILTNGSCKVGLNVGATAPLGIPYGVDVVSYAPNFAPIIALERNFNIANWFYFNLGIQFEYKGMRTRAAVNDYYTEVAIPDGDNITKFAGSFTGDNVTAMNCSYATLPLRLGFRITKSYSLKVGGYISWALSRQFSGSVENGYVWTKIEEGSTTSDKIEVERADFDFSKHLKKWDAGLELLGTHRITEHFFVDAGVSMGLPSTFPSDFTGVSFSMHHIYLALGVGYSFFGIE